MIIQADARALPMRDRCVQCVVTSPPYFGLRDYGTARQIGSEATPTSYVEAIVGVFREVRRVLADDGVVWLNLGDSYVANAASSNRPHGFNRRAGVSNGTDAPAQAVNAIGGRSIGLKGKDLIGIPWRVAFALQADGWYLRSDVIWSKPNPMPESVTDRPTKAHEYLFLLTKSETYYYDANAIRERASKTGTIGHLAGGSGVRAGSRAGLRREKWMARKRMQQPAFQSLAIGEVSSHPLYTKPYTGTATKDYATAGAQDPSAVKARIVAKILAGELDGRNKRSVWTIPVQPFAGAHFATMPEALVEPCILAGSRLGDLVLDPFLGSGTVGVVAERLGRRWVGTDLSYQPLSKARTRQRGIRFDVA